MQRVVVAYQGAPGAYSEQATYELLGTDGIQALGLETFEKVFQVVQAGEANYGMIPIENSEFARCCELQFASPEESRCVV